MAERSGPSSESEKQGEQSVEMFVDLFDARFYGEAASTLEGTRVEILGRRLSDGSESGFRNAKIGIRITGDADQLLLKMKELRSAETWANLDEVPDKYLPGIGEKK